MNFRIFAVSKHQRQNKNQNKNQGEINSSFGEHKQKNDCKFTNQKRVGIRC